jgi:hypothetical protein
MSFTATCLGAFAVVSVVIEIVTPFFVYSGRDSVQNFLSKEFELHRNSG